MNKYKGSYISYFFMYMFYYLSLALLSGLISVYLLDKGYSASQVSLVVSIQYILCMISQPLIGRLSDKYDKKKINMILLAIASIGGIIFIFVQNIFTIAAVYGVTMALINGVNPVIEQMATTSKYKYGSIRIWGTIGYATGSQISGLIYRFISPQAMYIFFALGILICVFGLYGTKEVVKAKDIQDIPTSKQSVLNKQFIYYLVIAGLFYGATNVSSTYLPAMYQDNGLTVDLASTIIFLGTMMELPVILLSHKYMNKIGNRELLMISFILLMIQFGTYAFIHIMPLKIAATILTKSVVTMAFIMINLKVVGTIVDTTHQITALALVSTFKSLISIAFQFMSGQILDILSFSSLYMILFITAVIGLLLSMFYHIDSGNDLHMFD